MIHRHTPTHTRSLPPPPPPPLPSPHPLPLPPPLHPPLRPPVPLNDALMAMGRQDGGLGVSVFNRQRPCAFHAWAQPLSRNTFYDPLRLAVDWSPIDGCNTYVGLQLVSNWVDFQIRYHKAALLYSGPFVQPQRFNNHCSCLLPLPRYHAVRWSLFSNIFIQCQE